MHLEKIILTNFRNYQRQETAFSPGLNCLTGRNGMGKTNLLDAVHYLCMGKSRLSARDAYVVRQGEDFFRLEGHFRREGSAERIVAKIIPGKSRVVERNGVPYRRLAEHVGLLPVVIIMPDDTAMVKEGSEERRRFLDSTLSQIDAGYLQNLINYNKILKQRNALLKQSEGRVDVALLQIYDGQMEGPAKFIHRKRADFVQNFLPLFEDWYKGISGGGEEVGLRYRSQLAGKEFSTLMGENLQKDSYLQRTTAGIHRDDLVFSLKGREMKRFASQGQLKSFVLSLGLARYDMLKSHKNMCPILLLDDIFDKLDRQRVGQLLGLLSQKDFGQIFLTDTHEARVREVISDFKRDSRIFSIDNACVERL